MVLHTNYGEYQLINVTGTYNQFTTGNLLQQKLSTCMMEQHNVQVHMNTINTRPYLHA